MPAKSEPKVNPDKPFAARVWDTLSRIDVSDHVAVLAATDKRPEVPYLPWHKAWLLAIRAFPGSRFRYGEDIRHPDGSMEVEVTVIIADSVSGVKNDEYVAQTARLPVMDYRFNAVLQPDARDINDARQRCLVKALSYFGLGLSLWDNFSKLPVGTLSDPIDDTQLGKLERAIEDTGTDLESFLNWAGVEELTKLPMERYQSAIRMLDAKKRRSK